MDRCEHPQTLKTVCPSNMDGWMDGIGLDSSSSNQIKPNRTSYLSMGKSKLNIGRERDRRWAGETFHGVGKEQLPWRRPTKMRAPPSHARVSGVSVHGCCRVGPPSMADLEDHLELHLLLLSWPAVAACPRRPWRRGLLTWPCPGEEVQVAAMADLAAAMDSDSLWISLSFQQWRRRRKEGEGVAVGEEVARCGGGRRWVAAAVAAMWMGGDEASGRGGE